MLNMIWSAIPIFDIKSFSQQHYWSSKDVKFPPAPPSAELCQNIVSDFCADTSAEVFEEAGCPGCGKLTPVCEMEELSDVQNINQLKTDGVTRKARCKSSDPVRELRVPILAPGCSRVCPICFESPDKKKVPTLALTNGLWFGKIPDELKNLTYPEQLLIAQLKPYLACSGCVQMQYHFHTQCLKSTMPYILLLKKWMKFWHPYIQVLVNQQKQTSTEHHSL